jgi:hypothetical protein
MKHVAMNPYLPLYEYIPDGEPRIFGDRLYVYGSHDYAGGALGFCPGDYMVWSAPLSDLGDWRCDGVGYPRSSCPEPLKENDAMAAPDVVQGVDGRYYLYYNANENHCHIGVSERPEGPFLPYGDVCREDGTPYTDYKMFDPGVLVENGKAYLFVGFCMPGPVPERFKKAGAKFPQYSLGFELASDMKTIVKGPVNVIPGGNVTEGTGFEGHGFYEASSPRKINESYVMVYSSELSHEMVYAIADEPLGPYTYKGTLVSCADFGYKGNTVPVMPYGNVHGGMVQLNGDWYIFYHRHTSGQEASRQGCAEKLPILKDGWFGQAEITSCGLNNGPLLAEGSYNACYCCHLTSPQIPDKRLTTRECRRETEPHIYEEAVGMKETEYLHYLAQIGTDTVVGYKYFSFDKPVLVWVRLRGMADGMVSVYVDKPDGEEIDGKEFHLEGDWKEVCLDISKVSGVHALYFRFQTTGPIQFENLRFE